MAELGLKAEGQFNGLLDFSVINTHVVFKGVYMGCTTANTELNKDIDTVDIMCQQKGSRPQDQAITGVELKLTTSLAGAKESIMALLDGSMQKSDTGEAYLSTELFTSLMQTKGGALLLAKSNPDGSISTKSEDHLWFYSAIPTITGNIVMGGLEQQSKSVEWLIQLKTLDGYNGYTGDIGSAFGYFGDDPTNLPSVIWPEIPTISHDGDSVILTYQNALEQNGSLTYKIVQIETTGNLVYEATGVIDGNKITITPLPISGSDPVVLSQTKPIYLWGSEGQVIHINTALSAMLPEVLVPYVAPIIPPLAKKAPVERG